MNRVATFCFLLPFLLPAAGRAQDAEIVAVAGEPFGIGRIEIPAPALATLDPDLVVSVSDADGRVLYPAGRQLQVPAERARLRDRRRPRQVGGGRILSRIGELIEAAASPADRQTVGYEAFFLFTGTAPLAVEIGGPASMELRVVPREAPARDQQALRLAWWYTLQEDLQQRAARGDYPPIVETYLIETLRRRLRLPPDGREEPFDEPPGPLPTLKLLAGTEDLRIAALRRAAAGEVAGAGEATVPLPEPPELSAPPVPPLEEEEAESVEIEPMALRLPPESFYIRFGTFTNYLWFQNLSGQHGGNIAQMISLRGVDYATSERNERQLNLRATELTQLLGPQVVEDIALVGTDLFLTDGAAVGVLMRARNPFLLATSLTNERRRAAEREPGATLRNESIGGRTVSVLATPDNRIRSFWVQDGRWQLITTSRRVAERFIEVAEGGDSLGETEAFRHARRLMPVELDHTIFAYFSSDFFRNLLSPQYQIELRRRMEANAAIDLVRLAQATAAGERRSLREIDELTEAGFLPRSSTARADESGPVVAGDQIIDSLRGATGTFLPIPDVPIRGVTAEEAAWYERLASFYSSRWRQMDPLLVGMRRTPLGEGRERVEVHAEVAPLVPEKYGWIAEQLGPPTRVAIRFAPDDIARVQAHVTANALGGTIPPHHLFAAVKDSLPPRLDSIQGLFQSYLALQAVPGYLGAWPQPGALDQLPLGIGRGRPVAPGMNRLIGGLYRAQRDRFSVLSFQPDVLDASVPHLAADEVEDPAQIRLQVDDLSGSRIQRWVNEVLYERAYGASRAGAGLLDSLTRQLQVDREAAPEVARTLLGGQLQCPLGGRYVLASGDSREPPAAWRSTAWPDHPATDLAPPGYQAPLLEWFRGVRADLTQYPDRLVVKAMVEMHHDEPTTRNPPVDPDEATPPPADASEPEEIPPPED